MFKIGSTRDLMTAAGEPCFPTTAFDVLKDNPDISWQWLDETVDEITPQLMAAYDGLHVNLPMVKASCVAGGDVRCKIIARNGVGYDTVDVDAMTAAGVIVTNTPIAVRRPVAVATLTLLFALAGRLFDKDRLVRTGRWNDRTDYMGTGLTSRRLGLIGAGSIGQEIMRLAAPFFGDVVAFDPYADSSAVAAAGGRLVSFDEVLTTSDFVTVCCLLTDETRHLMNAAAFAQMKPTAYYLNVGRGPIHDEAALVAALQSGTIAGAGLDVTEQEPIANDSPLIGMANTIITPHALCWTDECFEDIARTALQSIVDVSQGLRPVHVVDGSAAESLKARA
ncbi:MAG: 2-hydroxyacid dehydrogenase [Hyphomicrobiaceae bacterium]